MILGDLIHCFGDREGFTEAIKVVSNVGTMFSGLCLGDDVEISAPSIKLEIEVS